MSSDALSPSGPIEVALRSVSVVTGIIQDAAGRPLPGVTLWATPAPEHATKSDISGRFRLTYARPGKYSILPSADGHHFSGHVRFRTDGGDVVVRAVLPTFVAGRVVGLGGDVLEAEVTVYSETGEKLRSTEVDGQGRFRIEKLVGEKFEIRVSLDDTDRAVRPRTSIPGGSEGMEFQVEVGGRIEGRVTFPDGRPAAGAELWAGPEGHSAPCQDAIADAEGRFLLRGLLAGSWAVSAWLEDDDEDGEADWVADAGGIRPGRTDLRLTLERERDDD